MKNTFILFFAVLSLMAGAKEPAAAAEADIAEVKNFLGVSLRFSPELKPFFQETEEFSTQKINSLCGTDIKSEKKEIKLRKNSGVILPTIGFFSPDNCRNTYGLRFGLAERNALATDSGLNLALLISDLKQVNGIQICPFLGKTETFYGLQILPFLAFTQKGGGLQISLNSISAQDFKGVQTAAVGAFGKEISGAQISGLVTLAEHCSGMQISGLANLSEQTVSGVQISGFGNQTDTLNGVQIGLYNRVQKTGKGIQIGLINYMEGALFPWFPIFNFKF